MAITIPASKLFVLLFVLHALTSRWLSSRGARGAPRSGLGWMAARTICLALPSLTPFTLQGKWPLLPLLVTTGALAALAIVFPRLCKQTYGWVLLEDAAYICVLAGLAICWTSPGFGYDPTCPGVASVPSELLAVVALIAGLKLVWSDGSMIVERLTEPLGREMALASAKHRMREPQDEAALDGGDQDWRTPNGEAIGQLERVLVLAMVLAGKPEAIGFLVAAKAVLRYPEIRNARLKAKAEYVLVGTLASVTYALGAGSLTRLLIHAAR
jgi:hypothetical protein